MPTDDKPEVPSPKAYLAPGADRFTFINGGAPMTKNQAIEALRRAPPKDLAGGTEVEIASYADVKSGKPTELGKVRVGHTLSEMVHGATGTRTYAVKL